jgi:SAM-dependent methyltransferase
VTATGALQQEVIWHDLECASYAADLSLWAQLATAARGPVLELGCGTGRVALHLSRDGHPVTGIDHGAELVAELRRRANGEGLDVRAEVADAAAFSLGDRFGLILAPMQLLQLLPDDRQRSECLHSAAKHLNPGGMLALAIVEPGQARSAGADQSASPPLPDARELDGWVYSSLPLGVFESGGALVVERLRQTVTPGGRLEEARSAVQLRILSASQLEEEAGAAGLRAAGRRRIEATEGHVGSTVVLLEA